MWNTLNAHRRADLRKKRGIFSSKKKQSKCSVSFYYCDKICDIINLKEGKISISDVSAHSYLTLCFGPVHLMVGAKSRDWFTSWWVGSKK